MATGNDRIAIVNADGSFANPIIEAHLAGLIQQLLGPIQAPPALTSYATVQALPDYPPTFPFAAHGHTIGEISGMTTVGQALVIAASQLAARAAIGLDLVNNTSDIDKPISTQTQTALADKISDADARALVTNRPPTLFANSATTVPARGTVITTGYTGPVIVDISRYPRSTTLDNAALAVMLNGDQLIRRRA